MALSIKKGDDLIDVKGEQPGMENVRCTGTGGVSDTESPTLGQGGMDARRYSLAKHGRLPSR